MVELINDIFPLVHVIGSSTAGEIANGAGFNHKTLISISVFENTAIKSLLIDKKKTTDITPNAWFSILSSDTKAVILYSSRSALHRKKILRAIPNNDNEFVIAGGIAGGYGSLSQSWVVHQNRVLNVSTVAVSLSSSVLSAEMFKKFNWKPIGKDLKINRAEGNIIREIDGVTVVELCQKYLGDDIAQDLLRRYSLFPLVSKSSGALNSKVMLKLLPDGAGVFNGSYQSGEIVQLTYADYEMLKDNSFLNSLATHYAEAFFIYSCGESGRITAPSLPISEKQKIDEACSGFSSRDIYQALAYFTSVVTQEWLETKHELEVRNYDLQRLVSTVHLTEIYNPQKLDELMDLEIHRSRRSATPFNVIIIRLGYFKSINNTYDHPHWGHCSD